MDNLSLNLDAEVNHTLGLLRTEASDEELSNGLRLAPGALISIDPNGEIEGRSVTGGDNILSLNYVVQQPVKWMALHLSVGGIDLRNAAVFGVACKTFAAEATTFRVCLRSQTADGFVDAFLPKHVVAYGQPSTHVDLLKVEEREDVPIKASWRELVLFFAPQSAALDLIDFRVFIV
ncbi:hypothetical protein M8744_17565 [Lutimaribacter sp. EGI FJ00013]|uniref:Uncharacterized protein n=2 Tax=Lutimaribacter degradans TaxID=2945989 RepID=A0ACC6A035_9RHOB|nr:hypothetical protein [Lutimaribacter sp. EGI FJ00013]